MVELYKALQELIKVMWLRLDVQKELSELVTLKMKSKILLGVRQANKKERMEGKKRGCCR